MPGFARTIVLVVLLVVVGCAAEEERPQQAFDADAYCEAELELETLGPFESEDANERKAYAIETLRPAHEAVRDEAPEQIRDDFDVLVDAASKMAETGDPSDFGDNRTQEARRDIHTFDLQSCGWKRVEVTAVEYRFEGLGRVLASGRTSFELRNNGEEPHEIVLYRVKQGVTDTIEQLLELPEAKVLKKVTRVGAAFAEAGEAGWGVVDLRPGRYGAVCFIPVGGGEEGPPHFTKGMYQEFTVK